MGKVTHIVQLQFKSDVGQSTIQNTITTMLSLKDKCLQRETGKPYIVSSTGGKECSVEGMQNGITHVFVVEFASAEDRDYYAKEDPVHLAFGASLGSIVAQVQVVDIENGVY
ncbi:hypothetical protein ABOM_001728 [Aspergillus bombycis]|uniref:Stress-response A/B barrel domain-containing protein n=1 Tax=Aspergillus bombycis TaxID=109264 RepID=A0A1F8ACR3_9EURO|nr:hypothetical protein ABOM_001728 [Aspergillus bombycis]OGM49492.1 hypothetical protein ABOM_001728 [Aspergillus bombycis]